MCLYTTRACTYWIPVYISRQWFLSPKAQRPKARPTPAQSLGQLLLRLPNTFCPRQPDTNNFNYNNYLPPNSLLYPLGISPSVSQFLASNPSWDMDGVDSMGGLRGLYQDLSGITESSIVNIDRLCVELETHLNDFRTLLEKPSKNDNSRKSVLTGEATLSTLSSFVFM